LRNAPPARSDLVERQPELLAHPLFGELVEPCAERRSLDKLSLAPRQLPSLPRASGDHR
jgi:hypothetical protein